MKKSDIFIKIITPSILAILVGLTIWQIFERNLLNNYLSRKRQELKQGQIASSHLETLEKQNASLNQKESELNKKVPLGEDKPLSLIKSLISLSAQVGLKGATFSVPEGQALIKDNAQSNQAADMNIPGATPTDGSVPIEGSAEFQVKPLVIKMVFQATFPKIILFLDSLSKLERIVLVDGISIERKEELLPYQTVSLSLITYTF